MANTINANLGKDNTIKTDDNVTYKELPEVTSKPDKDSTVAQQLLNKKDGTTTTVDTNMENRYDDIAGNKEGYSPNSEGKANTGGGAEAALGTDYTWNKQGSSQAQRTYSNDVLTAKQNLLNNRQTAENNAVNYQAQADMMKYQNNQNAEKVGWTGGYVLDQNRQMDYLKASIQAQMYGAMELQRYGYDSSLAAARLSYDLNQQEYARQYYQEAVSAALSEAQLTGTYFSAETKDMMSQLSVAQQKKNDQSLSQEERDQAERLEKQIEDWFATNGISKEGVKTLEAWQQDQANELQWSNELWTRYQAALEAANTNIAENPSSFIMLDENGRESWDGVNVITGNWESWTNQDVANYLFSGTDGGINSQAVQQYYSYLDSTLVGETEAGFNKWCSSKGLITKDESGNTIIKAGDFTSLFLQYLKESNIAGRIADQFKDVKYDDDEQKNKEKQKLLEQIFDQWDFRFQMPDGTYKDFTYDELQEIESAANQPASGTPGSNITDDNGSEIKDWAGNTLRNYTFTAPVQSQHGDWKSTLSSGSQVCLTTAVASVDSNKDVAMWDHSAGVKELDFHVTTNGAYEDLNVEFSSNTASSSTPEINAMVYKATGQAPLAGQIITYGGKAYVYVAGSKEQAQNHKANGNTGVPLYYEGHAGWYPVKGQCGGDETDNGLTSKLKELDMLV